MSHSQLLAATFLAFAILVALGRNADAQQQTLLLPSAVAYDAAGDLYFVDTNRNQVFEVSLAGALSTIAGTGVQGFAGDGGAATAAELNAPQGIAAGADGTIYVSDTGNQRIRSIAGGQIGTFAGSGAVGFSGDNSPAIAAMLNKPTALAIDAQSNLLLCDMQNHRIRRIVAGVISTIAGTGVQGFAGDGGPAASAELDSPAGIAVAADGRIFIADSRNHRLRVIATDNTIQTFAGTGTAGYSGDGGPARAASLALPRGISVDPAGDVIFADSNNQRIRSINTQGVISTIAGSGVQGFAADGTASTGSALNTPRGLAVSSFGAPAFADAPNKLVRQVASNGNLYTIAGAPVLRSTNVSLAASASMVYGMVAATIAVSGSVATPKGTVVLQSDSATIATAALSGGAATVSGLALKAGTHTLTASYGGDGLNPAATSPATSVTVTPAPITAIANAATVTYGQPIPTLTGTSSGILPQDAAAVSVTFATSAAALDPVGAYPIMASMAGAASGNYSLTTSAASGSVNIVPAQSTLVLQPLNQTFYSGQSFLLTANIGSATSGIPTGEVDFADAGTVVAKSTAINGIASGNYIPASLGSHTITASYEGDKNFLASSSGSATTTVTGLPDFSISATAPSQIVQGGLVASYPIAVSSAGSPFSGSVTFSVAGLPSGVTASFSPPAVVPGITGATVILSVQTIALADLRSNPLRGGYSLFFCLGLPLLALGSRRKGLRRIFGGCMCLGLVLLSICGCGARTVGTSVGSSQSATLTINATSTNLVGAIVVHTAPVSLVIQ